MMIASQNTGNETPDSASSMIAVSATVPRLVAASTPAGSPTATAKAIAASGSSHVAAKPCLMPSAMGTSVYVEPQQPGHVREVLAVEDVGPDASLPGLRQVEEERTVEPEVGAEALHQVRRGPLAEHGRGGVAGDDAGEEEDEQGDADEHGHEPQETA